mmetsp:Transcript_23543/g.66037  ORF Transcript_23543/g.66037 Transcript_23543/m.66037 type:complete len:210 (-) Transcript_23543:349-978(-)
MDVIMTSSFESTETPQIRNYFAELFSIVVRDDVVLVAMANIDRGVDGREALVVGEGVGVDVGKHIAYNVETGLEGGDKNDAGHRGAAFTLLGLLIPSTVILVGVSTTKCRSAGAEGRRKGRSFRSSTLTVLEQPVRHVTGRSRPDRPTVENEVSWRHAFPLFGSELRQRVLHYSLNILHTPTFCWFRLVQVGSVPLVVVGKHVHLQFST